MDSKFLSELYAGASQPPFRDITSRNTMQLVDERNDVIMFNHVRIVNNGTM